MDNPSASVRGLALHPGTATFLKRAYALEAAGVERGLPLFRSEDGLMRWGGYGSFYAVCLDRSVSAVLEDARATGRKYGLVESCVSVEQDGLSTRHVNPFLILPEGMTIENRLSLYERNIKKHIRNTVAASTLRYEAGPVPPAWYGLHERLVSSLGRRPYAREWFALLEDSFGKDVVVASAFDGEMLVGALYCIRSDDYLLLFSIATEPRYHAERIDSGLYDRAIQYALSQGIRFVDFGLTEAQNKSLIAYKRAFGAVPRAMLVRGFGTPLRRALHFGTRVRRALGRRFFS